MKNMKNNEKKNIIKKNDKEKLRNNFKKILFIQIIILKNHYIVIQMKK